MREARDIAEKTARASYGRLLASLAARSRDIAAAEDALAEAFAAALEHWPVSGAPDSPEAWLLTAARRRMIDAERRTRTRRAAEPDLLVVMEEIDAEIRNETFADDRLKLLFVCAHPAIDPAIRTPLMLQTVLGLDAARIGSAFLVSPATMGQRLVRAKRKIIAAGIPFETPDEADIPERCGAVLDSIYVAFGAGYDSAEGADPRAAGLAEEAIYLGALVARLAPSLAEAHGLLALMQFAHSRRTARRAGGVYVPLRDQDTGLWDLPAIAAAEVSLGRAFALGDHGRFQIEAAIQSAHTASKLTGVDARSAILTLYRRLLDFAPSSGALVGYAAALAEAGETAAALQTLDNVDAARAERYQPYWATRAHALSMAGDAAGADAAFARAIALSEDPSVRNYLICKRLALSTA